MKQKDFFVAMFVVLVLSMSSSAQALDKTSTGFYWPIGVANFDQRCGTWLSRDSAHGGCYFPGEYHLGVDMITEGNFYAISDGTVYYKSSSGWGSGNCALLIKHELHDGTVFSAMYGHLRTSLNVGDEVEAGEPLGYAGPWSPKHIHFNIWYGDLLPPEPWGRMPNSNWPSTNGFVDPINFLNTHYPKNTPTGPVQHHKVSVLDTRWWSQTKNQNISIAWYPANVPCHKATSWHKNETCSADYGNKDACQKFYSELTSIDYWKYKGDSNWETVFFGDTDDYRDLCGY